MSAPESALAAAKARRSAAAAAVAEAQVRAVGAAADLLVCQAHVQALAKRRAGFIAAAKPDRVIAVDAELLRAKVAAEIAEARAVASTTAHTEAVAAERQAVAEVAVAAEARLDSEIIALARAFEAKFAAALEIGAKLKALCVVDPLSRRIDSAPVALPAAVIAALAKLPRADARDVPVHLLRNGAAGSDVRALRLAELSS